MYNFIIPGLYEHFDLNNQLLIMMERSSGIFKPNINIYAAYGAFQFSIWNGGRVVSNYRQASIEDMIFVRDNFCKEFNIKARFTFTNQFITESMLYNRFCNLQLEVFDSLSNEVVVNSDILRDYIIEHYPNYKLISSTTKVLRDRDSLINELSNPIYSMVCLDNTLNNKWDILSNIPIYLRPKCEILANEECVDSCPARKLHYITMDTHTTNYGYIDNETANKFKCPLEVFDKYKSESYVHPDYLKRYSDEGYNFFKLIDRSTSDVGQAMIYAEYMVLPEYRNEFVRDIISRTENNRRFKFVDRRVWNG